ncbi:MAG: hypothetical protein AUK55_10690 [Syntrophobacteraceae bacterium CG2_30_61_12]|nr:MAG: hypothetical protein AUK55_10690 [Syntrophobacteraceae bacterium CG2_30_61_12]PIU32307.1 MAG: hypothetical protein COT06_03430 [Syntrophobacteraceae bacterium CG07_land_8_20_14_0_80_61_8]
MLPLVAIGPAAAIPCGTRMAPNDQELKEEHPDADGFPQAQDRLYAWPGFVQPGADPATRIWSRRGDWNRKKPLAR